MRYDNQIDMPDALACLTAEMLDRYFLYGDDGEPIHPFERLRRDHIAYDLLLKPIRPRGAQK